MNAQQMLKQVVLCGIVQASLFTVSASAASTPALPKVFTFAAGYEVEGTAPHNIVQLGVIKGCGSKRCVFTERFDTAKMLPRVHTRYMHAMHAPYGGTSCFDDPVSTVEGDRTEERNVKLDVEDDGFSFTADGLRYRWVADAAAPAGYKLSAITQPNGDAVPQAVGFGFGSDNEIKGKITREQVAALYKGQIYHKTALSRATGDWAYAQSSIDFRVYQEADGGNVLLRSLAGDAAIVKKYGQPMWVQSSIVLARGADTIAPLVQEYGHDFNMDGCFNESGHNKLMLPVGGDTVSALLYIEYTSDYQRGFPMISVGRYYR